MPAFIDLPAAQTTPESISDLIARLNQSGAGILDFNRRTAPQFADLLFQLEQTNQPRYADLDLQTQERFLPRLLDFRQALQERYDPRGTQLGRLLQDTAISELQAGRGFAPGQEEELRQQVASEQSRFGRGTGLSDSVNLAKAFRDTQEGNLARRFNMALQAFGGVGTDRNLTAGSSVPTRNLGLPALSSFINPGPTNADIFNLQNREWNQKAQRAQAFNANNLASAQFDFQNEEPDTLMNYLGLVGGLAANAGSAYANYQTGEASGALSNYLNNAGGNRNVSNFRINPTLRGVSEGEDDLFRRSGFGNRDDLLIWR